jgi:hypothetical protein
MLQTNDPVEKKRLETAFVNDLKLRIDETSKYVRPEEKTMDFAFMFIPSEAVYYDLLINQETGRYLFRILAAKLILSQPENYGFAALKPYPQWTYKKQLLDTTILNLAYWCRTNGFSYKCFRLVNPWIRSNSIHIADSMGPITISIPTNCKTYMSKPLPINSIYQKDSSFDSQKAVFQNLVNKKDMIAQRMAETPKMEEFHEVKSGENLSLIASKYQLSMEELFELNPGLKAKQNKITKGLKLRILEKE